MSDMPAAAQKLLSSGYHGFSVVVINKLSVEGGGGYSVVLKNGTTIYTNDLRKLLPKEDPEHES